MGKEIKINIRVKRMEALRRMSSFILAAALLVGISLPAAASYMPFNTSVNMNVGIGTSTPQGAFVVTNGNVGVGTWAPAGTLDVEGGTAAAGTQGSSINIVAQDGGSGGQGGGNIYLSPGSRTGGGIMGSVIVTNKGVNPVNLLVYGQQIQTNYAGTAFIGNQDNNPGNATVFVGGYNASSFASMQSTGAAGTTDYINFLVGNNGGTEAMRVIDSGNVGIGSTNPGQGLDVQGTVRMKGLILNLNPSPGYVLVGNGVGVGTWMPAGTLAASSGTNYWLNTAAAGNVGISTANTVGIGTTFAGLGAGLVVMNGNVGIGTWVPAGLVDEGGLYSTSAISGFTMIHKIGANVNGIAGMEMRDTNAGNAAEFRFAVSDNNGDDYLAFSMPSTTNTSTIFGQTRSAVASIFTNHTTTGRILAIGPFDNEPMIFGTNNLERVRIDTTGNVGIGSLHPGQMLDVQGTVRNLGEIVNGNVGIGTSTPGGRLQVAGPANTPFLIDANGNVGIGTTITSNAGLSIMNGNVGIGTWVVTNREFQVGNATTGYYNVDNSGDTQQTGSWTLNTNYGAKLNMATAGPGAIFHISGNFPVAQFFQDVTSSTSPVLVVQGGATPLDGANLQQWQNSSGTLLDVVTNTGNVGVGSLTPGQVLDVQGTVRTTGLTLSLNPNPGYVLVSNSVGVGTWMPSGTLAPASGTNFWLNTVAAGNVGISTTNTVGIGTTFGVGAGLVVMNGNVGIGTWIPAAALDVETAGNTYFGSNVGIGSSAPGQALDVQGVLRTTNFNLSTSPTSGYVLTTDSFGNGTWQSVATVSGWTVNGANLYTTVGSDNVGIGTTTPQGGLTVMNGNVGIGTWMPGSTLFVNGGTITSYNATENNGEGILAYVGNGKAIAMQAGTNNGNILYDSTGGFSFQSEARGSVLAGTSSSQNITMFIDVNGNVGIGTNAFVTAGLAVMNGNVGVGSLHPGQMLDVIGTVRDLGEIVKGNVGIGTSALQTAFAVTNGNVGIGTWTAPGGILIIRGTGNVGIGSATPGQLLDVQGTVRALNFTGNGSGLIGIAAGGWITGAGTTYTLPSSNNVGIGTSTPQGGLVVTNGNVGIGTWAPGAALVVMNGNVGIGNSIPETTLAVQGISFFSNLGGTETEYDLDGANYGAWYNDGLGSNLYYGATPTFSITPTGTPILTLSTDTGNVGIGTGNPSSTLQVVGNVGIGTNAAGSTPYTLKINNIAVFNSEYNNGSPASPISINWANGNKQAVTLTAAGMTVNFTNPSTGVGSFQLKIVQDATGSRTITTWTPSLGNIYWAGGSAPTLTTTATYADIVSCYYDGTNYYCAATLNFQ